MLSTAIRTTAAVGFLAAGLGLVLAQGTEGRRDQKPSPQTALRAKSIIGSTVQIQGDKNVGTIQDIVLNDEGVVDYFIVSENGKLVTVPWEAAKFNFAKRTATINISPDQFNKVPTYTPQTYPNFYAPAYATEINGFYNLRPGQARRLERRLNR